MDQAGGGKKPGQKEQAAPGAVEPSQSAEHRRNSQPTAEERADHRDKIRLVLETIGIVFALIVVATTGWQTYLTRQTLKDAQDSSTKAETASKEMMAKFERMVSAAEAQALTDEDAVRETIAHNAELLKKMQASNELTRRVFLDSTRPWVGMTAINGPADDKTGAPAFVSDQSFRVNIWYKNFGQSPAVSVRVRAKCMIVPREPFPAINYNFRDEDGEDLRLQTIFPSDVKYTSRAQAITSRDLPRLTSLDDIFVVYGKFEYLDTSGRAHNTYFCRKVFLNGAVGTCVNEPAPD